MASMVERLFGFRIGRDDKEEDKLRERLPSPVEPTNYDAPMTLSGGMAGGLYSSETLNLEAVAKSEVQLITKYRQISANPEVDRAIDDIVNESIVIEDNKPPVTINMDNVKQSDNVKTMIKEEFEHILKLLDFNNQGYHIFRQWYIDGRLNFHKVIDIKNPRKGVLELRYIDPRKIKKIREEVKSIPGADAKGNKHPIGVVNKKYREYFIYNEKGVNSPNEGIRIAKDSIAFVHSGIINENNTMILSHLHKAIKSTNQLRWMEDAMIIYRVSRAPERRVFYIDVGNLPKMKAEQHLRDQMVKYKNKLVYNSQTGETKDSRRFLSMMEDFWFTRREGSRGTEVETLQGGQNLGDIEDINFFKNKLYESLNVPTSRMQNESMFNLGRASEVTRDEIKFTKFISRLRSRFSILFDDLLETQLILKGITDRKGWKEMKESIFYDFAHDNYFNELKFQEIMRSRFEIARDADEYVGRYFSIDWVRKNIFMQSDEDIKKIRKEIEAEKKEGDDFDDNFGAFDGRTDVPDAEEPIEEPVAVNPGAKGPPNTRPENPKDDEDKKQ